MKALRAITLLLALLAMLFFAIRLGQLLKKTNLNLDHTQMLLEKVRRIQKVNLASAFVSRLTPDPRSNLQVGLSRFYFKYVALIRVDVYIDYAQATYDRTLRLLRLPALEFEANLVPGASFLWKSEGNLAGRPDLEKRFIQNEEEIMRGEAASTAAGYDSSLRQKAYESCRQFFGRLAVGLKVEFADEK